MAGKNPWLKLLADDFMIIFKRMLKVNYKWHLAIALGVFWLLLGVCFAFISYLVARDNNSNINPWLSSALNFFKFCLWLGLTPLIFQLVKRFGFERRETFLVNTIIHISSNFLFSGFHTIVYTLLVSVVGGYQAITPNIATLFEEYFFFGNFFLNILLYALIVIMIQAYLLSDKYQTEEKRNLHLKAEPASAELQALKMQLQPHFLFNALHSISSLTIVNPLKANRMIARLGEFLRMTLDSSEQQLVSLNEEIEFLRCYLEIEQIRFSDRLTLEFEIDAATLEARVPHLILQPLVENAFKHGIAPFAAPGQITISAQKKENRLLLQVADNCAKNGETEDAPRRGKLNEKSSGTGLPNVRLRLEHFYPKNFRLEMLQTDNGDMTVELEIPLTLERSLEIEPGNLH